MPVLPFAPNPEDFNFAVSRGNFFDVENGFVFGLTQTIPAVPQDVWNGNGVYPGQPISNLSDSLDITSSNAGDSLAGGGAHAYLVIGLESVLSTEYTREIVAAHPTDGTIAVTTAGNFYRVSRIQVLTAGANQGALGTITVNHTTVPANVFCVVPVGFNRSQIGTYTVPAGHVLTADHIILSTRRAGGNLSGNAVVSAKGRAPGGVFESLFTFPITSGPPITVPLDNIGNIPPGTDLKFTVIESSDTDTIVSALLTFTQRPI